MACGGGYMDHKASWPWKKKSMEKTVVVESNGISSNGEVSGFDDNIVF